MSRGAEAVTGVQRAAACPPLGDREPPRPRRLRRSGPDRRKLRRGYQDKMLRSADYADKSMGWDLYGSAPA